MNSVVPVPGCSVRSASSPSSLATSCLPVGSFKPSVTPAERGGVRARSEELVASLHADIAQLAEIPRLGKLRALMIVDVEVVAIDVGNRERHAPLGLRAPVERGDPVVVLRLDFIVVARNLAHGDAVAPMARLVEVDRLVAQVEARAGLGPGALRRPVGIDEAKRRAAARRGIGGEGRKRGPAKCPSKVLHDSPGCEYMVVAGVIGGAGGGVSAIDQESGGARLGGGRASKHARGAGAATASGRALDTRDHKGATGRNRSRASTPADQNGAMEMFPPAPGG